MQCRKLLTSVFSANYFSDAPRRCLAFFESAYYSGVVAAKTEMTSSLLIFSTFDYSNLWLFGVHWLRRPCYHGLNHLNLSHLASRGLWNQSCLSMNFL